MGLWERLLPIGPVPRWMGPPAVLPGLVGDLLVLARTHAAAVAISGVAGYSTGFEFSLRLLLQREKPFGCRIDPSMEMHRWRGRRGSAPPEFPRLSVRFADGTLITNLDRLPFDEPDAEPAGPMLVETGGVSDLRRHDFSYWVWRLPPPGPVIFTCQWPACEIENAQAQIDGHRIRDAAARSIDPWPGDS